MPYNYNPRSKKIVILYLDTNTTVLSGQIETIIVEPPNGKVGVVQGFSFLVQPPTGATTGSHNVFMYLYGMSSDNIVTLKQTYDGILQSRPRYPWQYSSIEPSTVEAYQKSLIGTPFTKDNYLYIHYQNSTDVDQTNARTIRLLYEEFDELP